MNENSQKIALFIDADNAPASKFEEVLSEVAKYGVVTMCNNTAGPDLEKNQ